MPIKHMARSLRMTPFAAVLGVLSFVCPPGPLPAAYAADQTVTAGSLTFVNKGLVAVGSLPSNLKDKYGETFGSGSGMTVERSSWRRTKTGYEGRFVLLPD